MLQRALIVTAHSDLDTVVRIRALLPEAPLCAKPVDPIVLRDPSPT